MQALDAQRPPGPRPARAPAGARRGGGGPPTGAARSGSRAPRAPTTVTSAADEARPLAQEGRERGCGERQHDHSEEPRRPHRRAGGALGPDRPTRRRGRSAATGRLRAPRRRSRTARGSARSTSPSARRRRASRSARVPCSPRSSRELVGRLAHRRRDAAEEAHEEQGEREQPEEEAVGERPREQPAQVPAVALVDVEAQGHQRRAPRASSAYSRARSDSSRARSTASLRRPLRSGLTGPSSSRAAVRCRRSPRARARPRSAPPSTRGCRGRPARAG